MSTGGYKIDNPSGIYFITFAVVEWIDVFTRKEYRDIITESIKYCQQEKGLLLHGWCLMSNHIHLLVSAREGDLSDVLRDFKKFTSVKIIQAIRESRTESRREWMLRIFKAAGESNSRNSKYQFWRHDNQPKECITNHFIEEKLEYIHNNPVESAIVDKPEEYIYSSARDYSGIKGLLSIDYID